MSDFINNRIKNHKLNKVFHFIDDVFSVLRRNFYFCGALIVSKIILLVPYKISVGFISSLSGGIVYYIARKAARTAIKNLSEVFPEKTKKEIIKITKEIFINQTRNFFELANFPKLDSQFLDKILNVKNKEKIFEALKKGKGILFVSAHTGNWEMAAVAIARLNTSVNVIAKKIYIDGLNNMLVKYRESKNVKVILRNSKDAGFKLIRALKRGEIIAMLIDQDIAAPGIFVDFFGKKAWTPSGLATLALKTGAEILVGVDQRIGKYEHKIVISEPIKITKTGYVNRDVIELTQKATSVLEAHIRKHPNQWVWFHERWKTQKH
jgi:KDO2-lipid IV(A) lauroyltransferase